MATHLGRGKSTALPSNEQPGLSFDEYVAAVKSILAAQHGVQLDYAGCSNKQGHREEMYRVPDGRVFLIACRPEVGGGQEFIATPARPLKQLTKDLAEPCLHAEDAVAVVLASLLNGGQ